jgi:hypothetical protein
MEEAEKVVFGRVRKHTEMEQNDENSHGENRGEQK